MEITEYLDRRIEQIRAYVGECEATVLYVKEKIQDSSNRDYLLRLFGYNSLTGKAHLKNLEQVRFSWLEGKLLNEVVNIFLTSSYDWLCVEFYSHWLGEEELEARAFGKLHDCRVYGRGDIHSTYINDLSERFKKLATSLAEERTEKWSCLIGDQISSEEDYKVDRGPRVAATSEGIKTRLRRIVATEYGGKFEYYEGDKFVALVEDLQKAVMVAKEVQQCSTKELGVLFKIGVVDKDEVVLVQDMILKNVGRAMIKAARVLSAGKELTEGMVEGKIFVEKATRETLLGSGYGDKDFLPRGIKDFGEKKGKFDVWELKWQEI